MFVVMLFDIALHCIDHESMNDAAQRERKITGKFDPYQEGRIYKDGDTIRLQLTFAIC
jgi:hypothetical protein